MNTLPILAAISTDQLLHAVIWLIIGGIIFWLIGWLVDYCAPPEPFKKVAKVIIAIVAVLFLINALLTLVGKPFIAL